MRQKPDTRGTGIVTLPTCNTALIFYCMLQVFGAESSVHITVF
jgi:hypothetical protein